MTDHSAPVCGCGYTKDAHAYPRAAWTAGYVCTEYRPAAPVQPPRCFDCGELATSTQPDANGWYRCAKGHVFARPLTPPPAPVLPTELSDKDRVDYLEEMLPRMPAAVLIEYGEKGRITVFHRLGRTEAHAPWQR